MLRDGAQDRIECSEPERIMVWNGDTVVSRLGSLQYDMASDLVDLRVLPFAAQEISKTGAGDVREESSCYQ
jgi:hypothetical protein